MYVYKNKEQTHDSKQVTKIANVIFYGLHDTLFTHTNMKILFFQRGEGFLKIDTPFCARIERYLDSKQIIKYCLIILFSRRNYFK